MKHYMLRAYLKHWVIYGQLDMNGPFIDFVAGTKLATVLHIKHCMWEYFSNTYSYDYFNPHISQLPTLCIQGRLGHTDLQDYSLILAPISQMHSLYSISLLK